MRQDVVTAIIHVTGEMSTLDNMFQRLGNQMGKNEQDTIRRCYNNLVESRNQLLQIPGQVEMQPEVPENEEQTEPVEEPEPPAEEEPKRKKGKSTGDFF